MVGPYAQWMGGFVAMVVLGIAAYYSVVLGWCFYYFVYHCAYSLPSTIEESRAEWDSLQDGNYPILCHGVAVTISFLSIIKGVKTIELVNKIIVPVLLLIVAFSLGWSLSLTYADEGITYLFSPDWDVFRTPQVWVDAVTQNAWDTGAASALLLTYATYMRRHDGIVSMGTLTPLANNFVSLCCGIMIFCNVFSVLELSGYDKQYVISVLKENGPANTGLTFIWMPLLYDSIGVGRFLAILFFLSLSFAGLSSLIAMFELLALLLRNIGVPRIPAAVLVGVVTFLFGLPSAMDINILVNQDYVWGFALLPCGFTYVTLVWYYGAEKFRQVVVNNYGLSDWPLPRVWKVVILFVTPLVGSAIIMWWIVENIKDNTYPDWKKMSAESLLMVLTQVLRWIKLMVAMMDRRTDRQTG
jgi:NSS family neurotransmitter:Na+ symporter